MEFLSEQADFIHFVTGFLSLLLGGICVTLAKEDGRRLPWTFLGVFGLLQGIASWFLLFTDIIGSSILLSIGHMTLESASFVSLIEFGRKGFLKVHGKGPGAWIYIPFGVVFLFGGFTGGIGGFDAFSRYALGVTAFAWGGIVLITAADTREGDLRRNMSIAGTSIVLQVVPVTMIPSNPSAAGWDHIDVVSLAGIPAIMVSIFIMTLSACATLALWGYSCRCNRAPRVNALFPSQPIFNRGIPLAILFALSAGWVFTHILGLAIRDNLREDAKSEISNLSTTLDGVLSEIDHEAQLLSGSPPIVDLFSGTPRASLPAVNSVLDRYSKASPGMICCILDNTGKTIASSNRDRPDSIVGKSYAFLPYFTEAISGKPAWYFALGVTTGERGYYAGSPILGASPDPLGVAVIKKPLLDSMFHHSQGNIFMVVDPHGVIFLSGRKDLLFRALWPLPAETLENLIARKQFGPGPFTPLLTSKPENGGKIFLDGKRYFTTMEGFSRSGWSIVYLHPTKYIMIDRLLAMFLTLLVCSIIVISQIAIRRLGRSSEAIAQSHALLESSIESTADGILIVDQEGRIEKYNQKFAKMWGGPEEILAMGDAGKVVSHIAGQLKDRDTFLQSVRRLFRDTSEENLSTVEFTDGKVFEYYSIPKQIDGRNAGRVWSIRDITERERTEEDLRETRDYLENLLDHANAPVIVWDLGYRITRFNRAFERLTGRVAEEVLGSPLDILFPEDRGEEAMNHIRRTTTGERWETVEIPILHVDGSVRTVLWNSATLYSADGKTVVATIAQGQDITERKRTEQALRRSEQLFAAFMDQLPSAAFIKDREGRLFYANRFLETLLGWKNARGKTASELLPPEIAGKMAADDLKAMAEGSSVSHEKVVDTNGAERWFETIKFPIGSENGEVLLGGIAVEETGRRRAEEEREKLREQFMQSQKMEAIGKLAGGVAHDFNNILTAIDGYSELLLSRLGENSSLSADVMEIRKAGARAAALTRQLLAFSRMQVLQPKVLDLNDLVANMKNMLGRLIGENIELLTIPRENLGRVKADAGQIEQVLLNLVVNARDALPKGGRITIETSNETLDSGDFPDKRMNGRPGPYVMLAVADNGTGMDEKTMERIFEPFFTTKEKGKGTGLGLATVYGIVKQSGGYIWVDSKSDRGTTFRIHLPRVDGEATMTAVDRTQSPVKTLGTETVLVVEDMEMVRILVRDVLTRSGYTVLEATNGGEALALCGQRAEPIHLLLADMMMPGMTGTELAAELRPLRPGIKVLFMSGYTEFGTIDNAGLSAGSFFIQKPFTTSALTRMVRDVLDS